jgi:hypothetical protein
MTHAFPIAYLDRYVYLAIFHTNETFFIADSQSSNMSPFFKGIAIGMSRMTHAFPIVYIDKYLYSAMFRTNGTFSIADSQPSNMSPF